MKAQKLIFEEIDLELKEATLLSVEQFEKCKAYIPYFDEEIENFINISQVFWLKDEATGRFANNTICYAVYKYDSTKDWYVNNDFGSPILDDIPLRPIVVFSNTNGELSPGDRFQIADTDFTVIGNNIAIVDHAIGLSKFDKESTDYEKSEIKKKVDDWFQKLVKESN